MQSLSCASYALDPDWRWEVGWVESSRVGGDLWEVWLPMVWECFRMLAAKKHGTGASLRSTRGILWKR